MSADNWTRCPKCTVNWKSLRDKAIEAAKKKYGKIPADDYEELLLGAKGVKPEEPPETLREDYQLGTNKDGIFEVTYKCHCATCGLIFEFDVTKNVLEC